VRYNSTPRGVYQDHLTQLKDLMAAPGVMRRPTLDGELALPPGVKAPAFALHGIDPAKLEGIVIDDDNAELHGSWSDDGHLTGFVGDGYQYSSDPTATARFPFKVKTTGAYDVRVSWQPNENRAKAVPITVHSADADKTILLDQTQAPTGANGFQSIGTFNFTAGQDASVTFRVAGARGTVHIDAVQVVPVK
jgi:hypothetical protein